MNFQNLKKNRRMDCSTWNSLQYNKFLRYELAYYSRYTHANCEFMKLYYDIGAAPLMLSSESIRPKARSNILYVTIDGRLWHSNGVVIIENNTQCDCAECGAIGHVQLFCPLRHCNQQFYLAMKEFRVIVNIIMPDSFYKTKIPKLQPANKYVTFRNDLPKSPCVETSEVQKVDKKKKWFQKSIKGNMDYYGKSTMQTVQKVKQLSLTVKNSKQTVRPVKTVKRKVISTSAVARVEPVVKSEKMFGNASKGSSVNEHFIIMVPKTEKPESSAANGETVNVLNDPRSENLQLRHKLEEIFDKNVTLARKLKHYRQLINKHLDGSQESGKEGVREEKNDLDATKNHKESNFNECEKNVICKSNVRNSWDVMQMLTEY